MDIKEILLLMTFLVHQEHVKVLVKKKTTSVSLESL